jgi:shikimate kinase
MAKVFLIGYMGSGKSTAGSNLAGKLSYQFIDLDLLIEKENGMSIPQLFSTKGESEFRAIEHNTLKKLIEKDNIVVACGGGTPCYYNNMEMMNNNGSTVYLKLSSDALFSRLKDEKTKRPIIANKTDDDLKSFIKRQLEKREDFYHQAQFTVKAKDLNVDEFSLLIKEKIAV